MNILSRILKFIGEKLKTNSDDIDTLKTTTSEHTSNISTLQSNVTTMNTAILANSSSIKTLDWKIDNVSLNGLPYFSLESPFSLSNCCVAAYTTDSKKNIVFTIPLPKLPPISWSAVCFSGFGVVVRQNGYIYGSGWSSSTSSVINSPLFNYLSFDYGKSGYTDFYSEGNSEPLYYGMCMRTGTRININGMTMTISATVNDATSTYLSGVVNNNSCSLQISCDYIWFI